MTKLTVNQCLQSQVHLGHSRKEWNPKTAPYLLGERNNHHIFDVNQTIFLMDKALKAAKHIASKGGQILFLGRPPLQVTQVMKKSNPYNHITSYAAKSCGQPFSINKWVSGTFTNWDQMVKQLIQKAKKDYLRSEKLDARQMKLYTRSIKKKSRTDIYRPGLDDWGFLQESFIPGLQTSIHKEQSDRQIEFQKKSPLFDPNLEASLNKLSSPSLSTTHQLSGRQLSPPAAIFALGVKGLEQPLTEAQNAGIPIIAVVDSDCDPAPNNRPFDYIIPGNDDSIRAYAFYSNLMSLAINEGHQEFDESVYADWLESKPTIS